jgi:hypothetical protein
VRPAAVDLVVERLVLEAAELTQEQAGELAGLVQEELGRILAGAGWQGDRRLTLGEVKPVGLAVAADPRLLARVLAQRIAGEADLSGWVHGRA